MTDLHSLAVVTDTKLAKLTDACRSLMHKRSGIVDSIHVYAGDRKESGVRYDRARWGMTLTEAIAATPKSWDARSHANYVENLARVDADLAANADEIAACQDVWTANGCWSRFFMVPGGHIHRSMSCSTCNNGQEPTMFGWLPALSGLTEADAVNAHGPLLCTVCFPSAPTEWTNGRELEAEAKKVARCAGSGQYVATKTSGARYARCPECDTTQARTTLGKLRAHKAPKTAEAAR
jgi:hypothetical protein